MRIESEVVYLDASALVKLVVDEAESGALRDALVTWPRRATSRLAVVEVVRGVRRVDAALEPAAGRVLADVVLIALSGQVLRVAARFDPSTIRTLDAIHLASALRIRRALSAFVSYDRQQLEAAEALGLPVTSPR